MEDKFRHFAAAEEVDRPLGGLLVDLPVDQRDAIRMITTHLHDIPEMRCALGRVSDQKPMVTQRRQAFIPRIRNVCIPRAAQMSEHRGAQS